MLSERKINSSLSWAPFYKFTSFTLTPIQMNYFSASFCNTLWKKILMFITFTCNMFIAGLCQKGLILEKNYDLEDKTICLIILSLEINIALKCLTIVYYKTVLKKLTDEILTETNRRVLELWELKLAKKYYKVAKFIFVFGLSSYLLTISGFILLPMFSDKDYMMPILVDFPGSSRLGKYKYSFNYFIATCGIFYGGCLQIGFDISAYLQGCFIGLKLEQCIHYCSMIGDFDGEYNTDEKQSKLLDKCIKLHTHIFDYIDQVGMINSAIAAVIFGTGLPILTFSMYSMVLGTISVSPLVMSAATSTLFVYCFLGESVSHKCREVSTAIYSSQWYRINNIGERRKFLLYLTLSQRQMCFSAGGLFFLSLETFTECMKRVYGVYACLKEVL